MDKLDRLLQRVDSGAEALTDRERDLIEIIKVRALADIAFYLGEIKDVAFRR